MTDEAEVWRDADFLERVRVGTLSHDRGTVRFAYEAAWLQSPQAFALDLRGPERPFAGSLGFLQ